MASIKRIDHVAIAVRDVAQATEQYVKLLNAVHIRTEMNLNSAETADLAESLDQEAMRHILSSTTEGQREAASAIVEKRQARFTGR